MREENNKRKNINIKLRDNKAITLIALVITIIVLIILAGVSISLVLGDSGIITRAKEARKDTKLAEEEETIKMLVIEGVIEGKIDKVKIQEKLDNKFGTGKVQAIESGNGTITVEIKDSNGRQYAIESNGNVIREDKWDGESVTEPTQKTETEIHINTAAEFKWLEQQVNAGIKYEGYTIYLENSLDFGAREVNGEWETEENEALEWTAIGKSTANTLLATFEGNGNTIRGIYVNSDTNFNGIFGCVTSVQNLTVKDSYIKGRSYTGGLAAALISGQIENCHNINTTVIMQEGDYRAIGGLIGQNQGIMSNCSNSGKVIGYGYSSTYGSRAGGIAGAIQGTSARIYNCINSGSIIANGNNVGGVSGITGASATISNCYNTGTVTGQGENVGGVVGGTGSSSTISNCYNTGEIIGKAGRVGGIIGTASPSNTINNCYNTGTVTGKMQYTAGIVGLMAHTDNVTNSTTEKCYNSGKINGEADTGGIVGLVGGSSGQGTVKNCYSKGQVTGTAGVGAVIGRQTNITGLNTLNNLYYLNTVGIRAIGEIESNNSSDDEVNKIMSTKDDLKSYNEFLKWIDNK